jgi:hypothetical protein
MRKTLLIGLAVLVAGVLVLMLSSGLDLELESTALMGVAIGAVLALVPDRSAVMRIAGFLAGFAAAWIGYLVRAGYLPDTDSGRAVALALVGVLCVAVAAGSFNRVPLWGTLLGAAAMAGGYEATYELAPSQVVDTSMTAVTTILFTVAVGFLAAALVGPQPEASPWPGQGPADTPEADTKIDDMMENAR